MSEKIAINPSTGNIDIYGTGIQQVSSDPGSPVAEDSWVRKTASYQFSYKTQEGTIKRLTLS